MERTVQPIFAEDSFHFFVTQKDTLVFRILEIVLSYVRPNSLDNLKAVLMFDGV